LNFLAELRDAAACETLNQDETQEEDEYKSSEPLLSPSPSTK
jgi:hypothetical protein